jgi:hypothetical protein
MTAIPVQFSKNHMESDQQDVSVLLSLVRLQIPRLRSHLEDYGQRCTVRGPVDTLIAYISLLQQFFAELGDSLAACSTEGALRHLLSWFDSVAETIPQPAAKRARRSKAMATSSVQDLDPQFVCSQLRQLCSIRTALQAFVADSVTAMLLRHKSDGDALLERAFYGQACLDTRLGNGSFGCAYRMEYIPLGATFAVKRIDLTARIPQHYIDPDALHRECAILASLQHPSIVRYFISYYSEQNPFTGKYGFSNIVMELIEGGTLAEKVTSGPEAPAEPEIVEWARQMASALSYMHSMRVYHRDLKPENVMLTSRSTVKIIDLGLACHNNSPASLKDTLIGSPPYASYEKTTGASYDGRDDVWAMGLMFLELLKGERSVEHSICHICGTYMARYTLECARGSSTHTIGLSGSGVLSF